MPHTLFTPPGLTVDPYLDPFIDAGTPVIFPLRADRMVDLFWPIVGLFVIGLRYVHRNFP